MRNPFGGAKYANVTATMALVVALGGTSYAATNIGTHDLKRGAVTAPKIRNKAVKTGKIAPGAVTSTRIKNGDVTGADVDEATLGEVPSAADVPDMVMQELTLLNGWTSSFLTSTPTYGKDASGVVHLTGLVKQTNPQGQMIAQLPEGFRPKAGIWVGTTLYGGGAARFVITQLGEIYVHPSPPATPADTWAGTSLSVSFPT